MNNSITLENASPEVYRNWRDWCATISPADPNQFSAEDFARWIADGMPCVRAMMAEYLGGEWEAAG